MIAFLAVFGFVALAFFVGIILVRLLPPEDNVIDLEAWRQADREERNEDASEIDRW